MYHLLKLLCRGEGLANSIHMTSILKSKAFWSFAGVSGSLGSVVAYDRYQAHLLEQELMQEASNYGRQPLYSHQNPSSVALFLLARDDTQHQAIRETFRKFAVQLLTVAGIDYKWILEVDGEAARKKWDQMARDSNQPELMFEENSNGIPLQDLKTNLLVPLLRNIFNRKAEETSPALLWPQLRSAFEGPREIGSECFVALDPFTFEALNSELSELMNPINNTEEIPPVTTAKSSFLSRLFKSTSKPATTANPTASPDQIQVQLVPCDYPQGALQRLKRFLFGQHELTRLVGQSVMQVIRAQSNNK